MDKEYKQGYRDERSSVLRFNIWLLLFFYGVVGAAYAQPDNDERSPWRMKGFVDTYHAVRLKSPNNFMSSRTRVRAEVERQFGGSSIFVSLNASYNSILKDRSGFELREAYIDHREKNWGLRLGRQLVIWGAADGVRITDLVSPMDMTEFLARDYDDIRMPVNALRLFVFNERTKFEVVAVPTFEGYILPADAENPWSILQQTADRPAVWDDSGSNPAFTFSNIEYGGRLSFTLPGVDFSLSGLHTWNKMPVMEYIASPTGITVTPRYYRMGFVGGDISKPLGQLVLRGEAAFNIDKHFTYKPDAMNMPQQGFNSLHGLVGVDWYAPKEWMVMVQLASENIFAYKNHVAQPQNSLMATLNLSKELLNSSLKLSNFTYFDLSHLGWFSRFAADYAPSDQIRLVAGCDRFGGNEGVFSVYKNNSEVWIKAKYSF